MSDSSQHWPENSGVSGNTALDRPGWLPEGWTVEIKTRTSGSTAGRKDKYYIDPVTGCKLRSKLEVIRSLTGRQVRRRIDTRTGNPSNHTSQPVKKCIDMCTRNFLPSMKDSAEWLPAGWITEIKTRKHGIHAGEIYKCYIAPYIGCRFYSKKEVLYYLETGNIIRQSYSQKKRSINTLSIDGPPCSTEGQKSVNTTARRHLFGSQSLNSDGTTPEVKCIEDAMLSSSSLQNTEFPNKLEGDNIKDSKRWSLESEDRKHQEKGVPLKVEKKHLEAGLSLESKENGSSEKGVPLEMEYSRHRKLPENGLRMGFENRTHLEGAIPPGPKLRVKKAAILPSRASKRLAALKGKRASDFTYQPSGTYPSNNSSASNVVGKSHSEKPCTEESMGDFENEKLFHKDPESPLIFPFGDSWPDPCLEFAYKTLTDAIPVVENNSLIENYFQQQLGLAETKRPTFLDDTPNFIWTDQ